MKLLIRIFLFISLCVAPIASFAHDFKVNNVYYNIIDAVNNKVEVTYRGSHYDSGKSYSGDVVILSTVRYKDKAYTVTRIGNYAFFLNQKLNSITIPESVRSIGESAFGGCSNLASITIPNSVPNIGESVFNGCSNLASITIPNSVRDIGSLAFRGCSKLASITIPNSVTNIGNYAFSDCSNLASITIPNSVINIGNYAFSDCSNLSSITIPESVRSIGESAFGGCSNLSEIYSYAAKPPRSKGFISTSQNITIYVLKDYVDLYKTDKAWNCPNFNIRYEQFNIDRLYYYIISEYEVGVDKCKLPYGDIVIPSIIEYKGKTYSVSHIEDNAFNSCSNLSSITIPNSVRSIGESAFSGCSNLSSITIPNSVKSIGSLAFSGCSNLSSITIPNSVKSIGSLAFSGCSKLASITIPNSVTNIGESVFSGCSKLASITIPNSVTNIGNYAFSGCSNLSSITIPNSVKSIGFLAFRGCSKLASITIPNSVKSIGSLAFNGCSNLSSITIPNSVTNIGESVFSDCNITSVTITNLKSNKTEPIVYKFNKKLDILDNEVFSLLAKGYSKEYSDILDKVYYKYSDLLDEGGYRKKQSLLLAEEYNKVYENLLAKGYPKEFIERKFFYLPQECEDNNFKKHHDFIRSLNCSKHIETISIKGKNNSSIEIENNGNIYTYDVVFESSDKQDDIKFFNTSDAKKIKIGENISDLSSLFEDVYKSFEVKSITPKYYLKFADHPNKLLMAIDVGYPGGSTVQYIPPQVLYMVGPIVEYSSGGFKDIPTTAWTSCLSFIDTKTMKSKLFVLDGIEDLGIHMDTKNLYIYNRSEYRKKSGSYRYAPTVMSKNQSPIYIASMNDSSQFVIETRINIQDIDAIMDVESWGEYIFMCGTTTKKGYIGYENGVLIVLKGKDGVYEVVAKHVAKNKDHYYSEILIPDGLGNICLRYDNGYYDIINLYSLLKNNNQ